MLRQGRSVTETSYACGFQNLSHFSRSRAATALSPRVAAEPCNLNSQEVAAPGAPVRSASP